MSENIITEYIPERLERYYPLAFLAGVALIPMLLLMRRALLAEAGVKILFQQVSLFPKVFLVGLGTGYYVGQALRKRRGWIISFHIGAFTSLLVVALSATQLTLAGKLLIATSVFSLLVNASELDDESEIYGIVEFVTNEGAAGGLVFITVLQYILSIAVWASQPLSSYSMEDKVLLAAASLAILYIGLQTTGIYINWSSSNTID